MNKLKDQLSLSGETENISMMDLRSGPGDIMTQVECGKAFVIHKAGKPIAVLTKIPGEVLSMDIDSKGKVTYKA